MHRKSILRRVCPLALVCCILFFSWPALSEATQEPIPEPTLSPEASPYDAEHPENLEPEQLYGLSAVLLTADKGEMIFEKDPYTLRYPASTTKILTVLLGISLLSEGILNLCVAVSTVKIVKHQYPDVIDADFIPIDKEDSNE